MSGLQLGGLVSGLDTDAVISQLMAVERRPRVNLEIRQLVAQARQDAFAEIKSKLSALNTAATALRSAATWGDVQAVTSSNESLIAARQTAGAAPGVFRLEVTQLARAAQKTYDYTPPASATQLTVGGRTIDLAAGATLTDAVAAINADGETGVYAIDVGGRLVLSSKTTGAASTITASGTPIVEDVAAAKAGQDALFTVDGVAGNSSSNVVTTAIPGVELTLKGQTASPVDISVGAPAPDQALVEEKVKAFVDAYNAAADLIRSKITEEREVDPQTASEAKRGALFGDTALRSLLSSMRSMVGAVVAGNPEDTDALADLGISTGAAVGSGTFSQDSVNGKLVLDSTVLREKLAADPAAVKQLLGGTSGVDGFAQAFEGLLAPSVQAGGALDGAKTAAEGEVTRIKDALQRLDDRLARKEERLRAQFVALEQALARSQQQQMDLFSALGQS